MNKPLVSALVSLISLAGCAGSGSGKGERTPVNCPVHRVPVVKIEGYFPSAGVMADPAWDYVRFMAGADKRYPHKTPWALSRKPSEAWSRAGTEMVCPQCDSEFARNYAEYKKLSEEVKEARWVKYLNSPAAAH